MKATMGRENILAAVLAVASVLVAGILFLEWQQGLQLQQELTKMRTIPVTPVPAQKILPEFNLPNPDAGFPELISRSLFAVSRRSSASPGKGASSMKKGQFVLVGVLITPQQRSALLRDVQTNKTETVALVGVVRGITLGEVEPNRVVLRQGAESEELVLAVQAGPKQPALTQSRPLSGPAPSPIAAPSPVPVPGTRSNAPSAAPPGPPEIPAMLAPGGPPMVGSPVVGPTTGAQTQPLLGGTALRVPGPPSVSQ